MKVFCYFVEPASYTLDLASNIYEKNNIDYCFIKSNTLVQSNAQITKDYLDRNKKVLRSNLKMANKSVNDLNPQYTRRRGGLSNQYGSSYSSNYSSYDSSDDFGWLWWVGGAIIFLVALNS